MSRAKVIILFVIVSLLTTGGIVLSGYWKDKTTTTKVEFTGNMTLTKEEVFGFAKLSDSLIINNKLSLEMIESRIAKHPNVKTVNAKRVSTIIKIEITEKEPFAMVMSNAGLFMADNELNLYLFKKNDNGYNIPVISGLSDSIGIGSVTPPDIKKLKTAKYIISRLIKTDRLLYNYISEVNFGDTTCLRLISNDGMMIMLVDYEEVNKAEKLYGIVTMPEVLQNSFRKDIDLKLVLLDSFMKKVLIYRGNNSFSSVDLRYKDLIVVKNNLSIKNK